MYDTVAAMSVKDDITEMRAGFYLYVLDMKTFTQLRYWFVYPPEAPRTKSARSLPITLATLLFLTAVRLVMFL